MSHCDIFKYDEYLSWSHSFFCFHSYGFLIPLHPHIPSCPSPPISSSSSSSSSYYSVLLPYLVIFEIHWRDKHNSVGLVDTWIPDDNLQLCPFSRKQPDFAIPSWLTTFHFTVDIFPVLLVCSFISVNQGLLHNLASVISAMAGLGALISLFHQLLVLLEYT